MAREVVVTASPRTTENDDPGHPRSGPSGQTPVVLLHAGVADRRMWDGGWRGLAAEHDTPGLDLRGRGDSSAWPAGRLSTLILEGVLDREAIRNTTRNLTDAIAGATLVSWPDCAHLPSMERLHEFVAVLLDHCSSAVRRVSDAADMNFTHPHQNDAAMTT